MVRFEKGNIAILVIANKITVGYIGSRGFYIRVASPFEILGVRLSAEDLKAVALKEEEVLKYGIDPPICPRCNGTPHFPTQLKNSNFWCGEEIHERVLPQHC